MNPRKSFSHLKEQERQARREIIVSAAERVFASKPFHEVHIRDIAHEASISPALIYRYFPDQQALFVEAFLQNAARIIEVLDALELDRYEGVASLDRLVEGFINFLTGNDLYFKMLVNFMLEGSLKPELLERIKTTERQIFDRFDIVFKKVKPEGNVRVFSHALFAALSGILITFRNYPDKSPEELKSYMRFLGRVIRDMVSSGVEIIDLGRLQQ
ncbi:MAG: TetR/AcrR family transcriptional regulator [Spirochaetes bacterium]|nr:MAG: TetR/AcrR family transcriptional regulator [Spirochaetota bacterium]